MNEKIYHKKINGTREIDIMTKNSIIEVKSGKVRHKTKQFLEQQDLAREHNKSHIVYAPDITDKKFNELKSKGITVVRNKNDLLNVIADDALQHPTSLFYAYYHCRSSP